MYCDCYICNMIRGCPGVVVLVNIVSDTLSIRKEEPYLEKISDALGTLAKHFCTSQLTGVGEGIQ